MIRVTLALLASILTAVQAFAIYLQGQTLCYNNGCAVVDSLTTVSPLYFNLAGFLFFQILFWCLLWGRDGSEHWHKLARLLLLAGLCAEAVLVFFQYKIATVFCSYCMVILGFIVVLNILSGARQIFRGIVLFSAVTVACFSLQFRQETGPGASLDAGSMAILPGERQDTKLYLFFSSTCAHCEKVIDTLKEGNNCTVGFNPIERINVFSFPGVTLKAEYHPEINVNFMKSLALTEIPVLVATKDQKTLVLKGEQQIGQYLRENCRTKKTIDYTGTSSVESSGYTIVPQGQPGADDACKVGAECDTPVPGASTETKQ